MGGTELIIIVSVFVERIGGVDVVYVFVTSGGGGI